MIVKNKRVFHKFAYKDSNFRLCCHDVLRVTDEIIRQRTILEDYIVRQPEFKTSLVPLRPLADAPEIAVRMCQAGMDVGVGPMAAVAGAIAQYAAEAAVNAGENDVIVENGGVSAYTMLAVADHGYTPAGNGYVDIVLQLVRADVYERGVNNNGVGGDSSHGDVGQRARAFP